MSQVNLLKVNYLMQLHSLPVPRQCQYCSLQYSALLTLSVTVYLVVCVCVCLCVSVSTGILALQATEQPINDTSSFENLNRLLLLHAHALSRCTRDNPVHTTPAQKRILELRHNGHSLPVTSLCRGVLGINTCADCV